MNDTEIWKPVVGYELYEVSSFGRVRNKSGLILSQTLDKKDGHPRGDGRFKVSLYDGKGNKKDGKVHRLVAFAFCDGYSELNNEVNHIDLNCKNNHYLNLEWCDRLHNARNRKRTGKITEIITKHGKTAYRLCYTPSVNAKQIVKQFKTRELAENYLSHLKGTDELIVKQPYDKYEKITCDRCGEITTKGHLRRHQKAKKCQTVLKSSKY